MEEAVKDRLPPLPLRKVIPPESDSNNPEVKLLPSSAHAFPPRSLSLSRNSVEDVEVRKIE